MSRSSPRLTPARNSGTPVGDWIRRSILMTASLAPPCRGPCSAAMPADTAEYGSTREEPTERTALVEQFCSWSAFRIHSTSTARSTRGSAAYLGSAIFHIIDRKLAT